MAADRRASSIGHSRARHHGGAVLVVAGTLLLAAGAAAQPDAAAERQPPVEIFRGSVATPPAPAAGADERRVIGGERIWFVDEARGTLVGCRLVNTVDVGGQAIRCSERRLPKGRPARQ